MFGADRSWGDLMSLLSTRAVGAGFLSLGIAVAVCAGPMAASADIVPTIGLGTASSFAVLAGSTVTNTGGSVIDGDVGVSPGLAIVGYPPGHVNAPSALFAGAPVDGPKADLVTAYNQAHDTPATSILPELGGQTLIPGGYFGTAHGPLQLTGDLVLDGQDNASAVWVFQTDSTLTTASGSTVSFINGGSVCNVFWQVGSSATIAGGSSFVGTVMALTSITAVTGADIEGRLLARNGAVTLDTNTIFVDPGCVTGEVIDRTEGTADSDSLEALVASRTLAATGVGVAPTLTVAALLGLLGVALLAARSVVARRRS